ncbi:MAG: NAD-dependent epimerase/dehydratase family protein [Deltaproteobacteria bacterium]|nr:NAD-dependent epimerase/dehydratase family protein [Deltaproteobacteria bacterium]
MAEPKKILITGAAGFVGTALCRHLHGQGYALRAVVRRGGTSLPDDLAKDLDDVVIVDDLAGPLSWPSLLEGVESVIHLAGRAHGVDQPECSSDLFFHDNLDATVALGRAAATAGVKKFIFLSSIKVNGEGELTASPQPYGDRGRTRPQGAYAESKWRAEQELKRISMFAKGFGLIIIRSPLVYGPGVKGNFATLLGWLRCGWPVPVALPENRRSFLYIANLTDFIEFSVVSPSVEGRICFPADDRDYSLAEMATMLSKGLGRSVRLCPLPSSCLKYGAALFRCPELGAKLFGSLLVDRSLSEELGWRAPYRAESGIAETAYWWLNVK